MDFSCELAGDIVLRTVRESDSMSLAVAFRANRAYLAPWEPVRPELFYTAQGQQDVISKRRTELAAGTALPMVLVRGKDVLGLLTLSSIVRGAFQNASVGYWIDQRFQRTGLMTAAVGAAVYVARKDLKLHRLEAATLMHNIASQRVLEKNGFEPYGMAPAYLQIAGRWQDHRMYQRILS